MPMNDMADFLTKTYSERNASIRALNITSSSTPKWMILNLSKKKREKEKEEDKKLFWRYKLFSAQTFLLLPVRKE